jgi:small subunit ribosomal protein S6
VKDYEGMFIIRADLDKDLKKKTEDFISGAITKEGGTVKDFTQWGKNRLAYKIKRRTEGLYILTHFSLPGERLTKVQKAYNLNENILKTLIVQQDAASQPQEVSNGEPK